MFKSIHEDLTYSRIGTRPKRSNSSRNTAASRLSTSLCWLRNLAETCSLRKMRPSLVTAAITMKSLRQSAFSALKHFGMTSISTRGPSLITPAIPLAETRSPRKVNGSSRSRSSLRRRAELSRNKIRRVATGRPTVASIHDNDTPTPPSKRVGRLLSISSCDCPQRRGPSFRSFWGRADNFRRQLCTEIPLL